MLIGGAIFSNISIYVTSTTPIHILSDIIIFFVFIFKDFLWIGSWALLNWSLFIASATIIVAIFPYTIIIISYGEAVISVKDILVKMVVVMGMDGGCGCLQSPPYPYEALSDGGG